MQGTAMRPLHALASRERSYPPSHLKLEGYAALACLRNPIKIEWQLTCRAVQMNASRNHGGAEQLPPSFSLVSYLLPFCKFLPNEVMEAPGCVLCSRKAPISRCRSRIEVFFVQEKLQPPPCHRPVILFARPLNILPEPFGISLIVMVISNEPQI